MKLKPKLKQNGHNICVRCEKQIKGAEYLIRGQGFACEKCIYKAIEKK